MSCSPRRPTLWCCRWRRLSGAAAQCFSVRGMPDVKPAGQEHLCGRRWLVRAPTGIAHLSWSHHRRVEGGWVPHVWVQEMLAVV